MDTREAVFAAVRDRLVSCTTLTNMVASSSITITLRKPVSTFPAIRMRVIGSEGRNFRTFISGDLYLNIYSDQDNPAGQLASINSVVASLLVNQQGPITTSNAGFGRIWEEFCDYPLIDEKSGIQYLASRYRFIAQKK